MNRILHAGVLSHCYVVLIKQDSYKKSKSRKSNKFINLSVASHIEKQNIYLEKYVSANDYRNTRKIKLA